MIKMRIALVCLLPLIFTSTVYGQFYNGPESVAFDSVHNRYLVSNYHNGVIIEVDSNGVPDTFLSGLTHCYGNHINGNILYVSTGPSLIGIDLDTRDIVFDLDIPIVRNLDGNTSDSSGFIYVLDTVGKIYKVNPEYETYSLFVSSGLSAWPQDMVFDRWNNRLLVVGYSNRAPVQAVDLEDSIVYTVAQTSSGYFDGITMDDEGNVYLASHSAGGVIWKFDSEFQEEEPISTGHNEPAGLDYNIRDDILAVPNFGGNTVDFIPMNGTSVNSQSENMLPFKYYLYQNYPNPFNSSTEINFLISYESKVGLDIYNMLGAKVETLINQKMHPGMHSITWNADAVSSGIYFYKLKIDSWEITKRMTLLK
ncbi:MAG: T9SS type A sorting domain-containing protein [candidate division Zixibacteria bacterium]|nr:T9SS type A sorting domain-containing protein [candidate division Zixibacteria bacterium]